MKISKLKAFNNSVSWSDFCTLIVNIDKIILRIDGDFENQVFGTDSVNVKHGKDYCDLIISANEILRNKSLSEIYATIKRLIETNMPILNTEKLIAKSIEYAIDLPLDFNDNSSLLRLFSNILSIRHLRHTTKAIAIDDYNSLEFTSYSFKTKLSWNKERSKVPIKFQIYNKQLDLSRINKIKVPPLTRFELTTLFSSYQFSEKTLNIYKDLYFSFVNPIDPEELTLFEKKISLQLYKNFCQEKLKAPKLQITAFILKKERHFMTKEILCHFYQLLFNNKFVKYPLRKFYSEFKKTKNFANIKFSSLEELNNLINSLRVQLS